MASGKKNASWLKALSALAAAVFIFSLAWAAFYYIDERRSQSALDGLSEGLNSARGAVQSGPLQSSVPAAENSPPASDPPPAQRDPLETQGPQIETEEAGIAEDGMRPAPGGAAAAMPGDNQAAGSVSKTPSLQPAEPAAGGAAAHPSPSPAPDALSLYYASLKERNPDFGGWIHIEGTIVDYPVMYTPGALEKYLHRDFEGRYSFAGLPFLDTAYPPDSEGVNQIIYAHNMKSGQMFAVLNEYLKDDFWQEYRALSFDTLTVRRSYEVLALIPLVLGPMDDPKMMIFHPLTTDNEQSVAEINAYLTAYARRLDGEVQPGDDLLTLVTCRHARDSDRLILVARRRAE